MSYKLGVDVGGTFTDVFLLKENDGTLAVHKVSSTPNDPSKAIIMGIYEILQNNDVLPREITYLAHGTTVATNAIIEQKGGKVGLLTTQGSCPVDPPTCLRKGWRFFLSGSRGSGSSSRGQSALVGSRDREAIGLRQSGTAR